MIKKFEEFVNEMYSPTSFKKGVFDFIDYLESIGMTDDNIRAEIYDIAMNNHNFYYTPEETENILKRLPGCDSIEGIVDAVKTVFFGADIEIFSDWVKNHNGDLNKCPIVLDDYSGKLLTGVVWYCGALDKYSEDDDSFSQDGFDYLCQYAWDEGYTNDGGEEYAEEHYEDLEIDKVDLDKVFGWREE